ncbi:hypothetical protein CPC08DRAFT_141807 [Agrocybe pediades]|nr:hypothetical protein CPC08DRAFT_141807 [Agrocybe pediades]
MIFRFSMTSFLSFSRLPSLSLSHSTRSHTFCCDLWKWLVNPHRRESYCTLRTLSRSSRLCCFISAPPCSCNTVTNRRSPIFQVWRRQPTLLTSSQDTVNGSLSMYGMPRILL